MEGAIGRIKLYNINKTLLKYLTTLLIILGISSQGKSQFEKHFDNEEEWRLSSKILLLNYTYSDRSAEITYNMDQVLKLTDFPDPTLVRLTISHYFKTNRNDKVNKLLAFATEQNICGLWKNEYDNIISDSIYKPNCSNEEPADFELSQRLVTMFLNDQSCRGIIHPMITENLSEKGYNIEYDLCIEEGDFSRIDSTNTKQLKEIIEQNGIPEYSKIGFWGMQSLTTIPIHSPDIQFMEQSLKQFNISAKNGNKISRESLALLADKISVDKTGETVYGTQGNTKINDCETVDSLRMSMGMFTLNDYIKLNRYDNMCK